MLNSLQSGGRHTRLRVSKCYKEWAVFVETCINVDTWGQTYSYIYIYIYICKKGRQVMNLTLANTCSSYRVIKKSLCT
jgi:hypothetical protein